MSKNEIEQLGDKLDFELYQEYASRTAIYPRTHAVTYPILGLVGEAGEFANKWKKVIRDGRDVDVDDLKAELGDILWYVAALATDLEVNLQSVAFDNLMKLMGRQERGTLGGSGDVR